MHKNSSDPLIETTGVGKKIPLAGAQELIILDDVSLSISAAESVAIAGASGSGKTTLLGLLAGLDLPSSGDIRLLGQTINRLNEDRRAELRLGRVGFVFQSFNLMEHLTALENVMVPLELVQSVANPRQAALEALRQLGLQARADHLPGRLSGGEQQRVALARAFVTRPAVLFADEPTGNLDRHTGEEIIALLFSLQKQYSTTLVMVTHDDNLARQCQSHYRLSDATLRLE